MGEPISDLPLYPTKSMLVSHRDPGDDFFCIRYKVWYPSRDCAIRTKFETAEGCLSCEQGRFNLKRHSPSLRGMRFRFLPGD